MTPAPERSIIPTPAWIVAAVVSLGMIALGSGLVGAYRVEAFPVLLALVFGATVLGAYIVLIGYVYADAKRRGMRHVLWTWICILVPNGLGIVLYFILREPLLVYCSRCGYRAKPGFAYCPSCGFAMSPTCPNCHKVVQPGWPHCAFCGTSLTPARTNPSAPTTGGIPGTA